MNSKIAGIYGCSSPQYPSTCHSLTHPHMSTFWDSMVHISESPRFFGFIVVHLPNKIENTHVFLYMDICMTYWKQPSYHCHTYPSVSCGCSPKMSKHSVIGPDSAEIAPRLDLPRGLWDTPLHMQTLPPNGNIIL